MKFVVGMVDWLGEESNGAEGGGVDSSSEDNDEILVVKWEDGKSV